MNEVDRFYRMKGAIELRIQYEGLTTVQANRFGREQIKNTEDDIHYATTSISQ
ncbi:hypothetical protein [Alteromonas sp. 14N.309.X.WAT.G.H12]|uniref:hypothetical protein n=1 Tax=Alteromonas sp. 14N.309.X.WAT.G.H12 TaxID=3120824 RepID=UPI002FD24FF9